MHKRCQGGKHTEAIFDILTLWSRIFQIIVLFISYILFYPMGLSDKHLRGERNQ
jgi:hypothetical protein